MRIRVTVVVLASALVLPGCSERPTPVSPSGPPLAAISDGLHGAGTSGFVFLPPLVGSPAASRSYSAGTFDPQQTPVVRVFAASGAGAGGANGCTFSGAPVFGPVAGVVVPGEEHYAVEWNTRASSLASNAVYRICVFISELGPPLGFVDVAPTAGGGKNARTGDVYTFHTGRPLAIKFRIDEGVCIAANDGVLCEREWATASTFAFDANLPGGGTVPAMLYVWNDATDLHLAVRFASTGSEQTLAFEFDNDNDGVRENGDDVFLLNPPDEFVDDFRTSCAGTTDEAGCGPRDIDDEGSNDGSGSFRSEGGFSVYELSHPLNSGDVGHDFSLSSGDTVGMFLFLRMLRPPSNWPDDFGDTDYPGWNQFLQIKIR